MDEEIEGIQIFSGARQEAIIITEEGSVFKGTVDGALSGNFGGLLLH
jgi:hypothetical protein